MTSSNLISHVCDIRKFVIAILPWKQGVLCDKRLFGPSPYSDDLDRDRLS